MFVVLLESKHPDAVPERPLEVEAGCAARGRRPRAAARRAAIRVLLPGLEEERVVAEQDVVALGRGAMYAAASARASWRTVRLPLNSSGVRSHVQASCATTSAASAALPQTRPSRAIPAPAASATNGSRKIRWRVSGEPVLRATTSAASGTSRHASRQNSRLTREHGQPGRRGHEHGRQHREPGGEVARRLPDVARRRPVGCCRPATPASNRPASTRSVSQKGMPSTATAPNAQAAPRSRSRRATTMKAPLRGEHERAVRMGRDCGENRQRPERPRTAAAALERRQQREIGKAAP